MEGGTVVLVPGHQMYFVIYYSLAASVFERLFSISWGGCLSVGGVVLRLDCLARQLIGCLKKNVP